MTTKKEGDWEGWQRRVKRQTWEEWESNFVPKKSAPVSRTSTLIGKKINNNNNSNVSLLFLLHNLFYLFIFNYFYHHVIYNIINIIFIRLFNYFIKEKKT